MLGPRKRPASYHPRETSRAERRQAHPGVEAPGPEPYAGGDAELEAGDNAAGLHDPCELAQRRPRLIHVAQQVGEGEVVELILSKGQPLSFALDEARPGGQARIRCRLRPCPFQHRPTLVKADRAAAPALDQSRGHQSGAAGDVEDAILGLRPDRPDCGPAPAPVLEEAERGGDLVVAARQLGEHLKRMILACRSRIRDPWRVSDSRARGRARVDFFARRRATASRRRGKYAGKWGGLDSNQRPTDYEFCRMRGSRLTPVRFRA